MHLCFSGTTLWATGSITESLFYKVVVVVQRCLLWPDSLEVQGSKRVWRIKTFFPACKEILRLPEMFIFGSRLWQHFALEIGGALCKRLVDWQDYSLWPSIWNFEWCCVIVLTGHFHPVHVAWSDTCACFTVETWRDEHGRMLSQLQLKACHNLLSSVDKIICWYNTDLGVEALGPCRLLEIGHRDQVGIGFVWAFQDIWGDPICKSPLPTRLYYS